MSGSTAEPDKKQERIHWITGLQIISMFLIVLSHSVPDNMAVPKWMTMIVPYLQNAGLTAFMWASAYLTVKTRAVEKYGYAGFVKKRALRLLVPYFACSVLMIIPKALIQGNAHLTGMQDVFFQLAAPREGILPHLWFLPTLFLLSCAMPIWRTILRDKRITALGMAAMLGLQFVPAITKVLCVDDVIIYALWFYIGLICAEYSVMEKGNATKYLLGCCFAFGGGV